MGRSQACSKRSGDDATLGAERIVVDACVVALGSRSPSLLAPLGIPVPVYPVKGYSLTIPVRDELRAPVSAVLDETYKVAITRFDKRTRVGGMAEPAGHDLTLQWRRRKTLEKVAQTCSPVPAILPLRSSGQGCAQ